MDWLDGAAAFVTILSFVYAVWQHRSAKKVIRGERELLADYRAQVYNAQYSARLARNMADDLVQTAKLGPLMTESVLTRARHIRATLSTLEQLLVNANAAYSRTHLPEPVETTLSNDLSDRPVTSVAPMLGGSATVWFPADDVRG